MANPRTRDELRTEILEIGDLELDSYVTPALINEQIDRAREELYDMVIEQAPQWATKHTEHRTVGDRSTIAFPRDLYQLVGVDWKLQDKFRPMNEVDFARRNDYQLTHWGIFLDPKWRETSSDLEFFPTPQAEFIIRLWWIPCLDALTDDDCIDFPAGWGRWIIYDVIQFFQTRSEDDITPIVAKKNEIANRISGAARKRKRSPMKVRDVRGRRIDDYKLIDDFWRDDEWRGS